MSWDYFMLKDHIRQCYIWTLKTLNYKGALYISNYDFEDIG